MLCVYYNDSINKNPRHPENHKRILVSIKYIKEKLQGLEIYDNEVILTYLQRKFNMGSKEDISKLILNQIYSDEYLEDVKKMCSELEGDDIIEGDTYFSNVTYNEILDNSVILYNVCYQINVGRIKYAYCLIRPPSHHSSLNMYNGFCIVNHTYLTAKYLYDKYNKKVLILDYDVHHGDGTQKLVKTHMEDDIYFVSMHCYGHRFYPGTGNIDENNEKVLNVPMKMGTGDQLYLEKFNEVKEFIESKKVDIVVISNGLDAHHKDPFAAMNLTNKFYVEVTSYLKSLDKPLIYILEGGYNPKTIGNISVDIINELKGLHEMIEYEDINSDEDSEVSDTE